MLPVRREPHDLALDAALAKLGTDRAADFDRPDAYVTALRRLRRIDAALHGDPRRARRFTQTSARCPRHRPALHASGRGDRSRALRSTRCGHHADGVRQDALLQRAGPARSSRTARAARCISSRPKRSRRISSPSSMRCARRSPPAAGRTTVQRLACSPTTATRRRTRADRFGGARMSCSATPTWCTRASCRITRAGRSCSKTCDTSSSTSSTPIAVSSAATSRTCCAGFSRICRHYGSSPVFLCSSATIANPRELAERLTGQPFELVDQERRAPRREILRVREPAGREPAARHPPLVSRRDAAHRDPNSSSAISR